jgi:hypothetical protein
MVLSTPTDEILELVFHADAILRSHGTELKVWLCNDQFPDLYSAGKAASEVFDSDENWKRLHSDVCPPRPRKHYAAARPDRSFFFEGGSGAVLPRRWRQGCRSCSGQKREFGLVPR